MLLFKNLDRDFQILWIDDPLSINRDSLLLYFQSTKIQNCRKCNVSSKKIFNMYIIIHMFNIFWIIFQHWLGKQMKTNLWENRLNRLLERIYFKILGRTIALLDLLIFVNSNWSMSLDFSYSSRNDWPHMSLGAVLYSQDCYKHFSLWMFCRWTLSPSTAQCSQLIHVTLLIAFFEWKYFNCCTEWEIINFF